MDSKETGCVLSTGLN